MQRFYLKQRNKQFNEKLGSWLDVSGVWCELPFMVDELPEGWRLFYNKIPRQLNANP